jgi:ABC-2 type transport system ATP-binding protein
MSTDDTTPVIEVSDLSKEFGETRAVDHVSFSVDRGELFGFLGPNGAGKTTTIRILATLSRPTSGIVRVAGHDVVREAAEVRKKLGVAMQTPTLDAFSTGRETLELAGRLHRLPAARLRRRVDELLELMGLTAAAKKLTGTYSGGMKRRLDLAAALMHQPPLLILDEPTEGLDPQSRTALWEELERIGAEGTTLLLTTHYMEEADRLCSRLAIIDSGRLVVEGRPQTLKAGIGADTVTLRLERADGDGDVRRLCSILDGMVPCEAIEAHPDGVALSVLHAEEAIPSLLYRLQGGGVHVAGLSMSQPSLDDVFLKYTGRRIREEAADQPIILGW